MKRWIEPLLALMMTAVLAWPQDDAVCVHPGSGPTRPARITEAERILSGLERDLRARPERITAPRPVHLPRCTAPETRRGQWPKMPDAAVGRVIRVDSAQGASPELIRELKIRCIPTEVRFLADGEVEWIEE